MNAVPTEYFSSVCFFNVLEQLRRAKDEMVDSKTRAGVLDGTFAGCLRLRKQQNPIDNDAVESFRSNQGL